MRILYSCLSPSWGGMEMYVITAINKLLERNIAVELLCLKNSKINEEAKKLQIPLHTSTARGYFHPSEVLKIRSLILKNNFDLIHTQASKDLWLLSPALATIRKKIPLFLTKQLGSYIIKKDLLHRFVYSKLAAIFAISSVILKNVIDTCPIDPNKVFLLPNGLDLKRFNSDSLDRNSIRSELEITEDEIVLGMIGRISPGKGHEEFLTAAKILSGKHADLKFLIVGDASRGEDEYAEKIKNMAARLDIPKIIFTGFRSDTDRMLAAMDIFIFPSHSEAQGIALMEAMAMRKACVCSKADGVLDIIVDTVSGVFFEKQNADDLALQTEKLIVSERLRGALGIEARKRIEEKFDLENLTEQTLTYYRRALELLNARK